MVSMKDIALECRVSSATVCKALNGSTEISQRTKNIVLEAAKRLGYYPNSAARALKTNRTCNIGVLYVDGTNSGLTHEYFSGVLNSIKDAAEQEGYDITFIGRNIKMRKLSYYEHCRYRSFDGVVIVCVDFTDPEVIELVNGDIPVVTIDHIFENRPAVISDNVTGMGDLVKYAYGQGHTKLAYMHGQQSFVTESRLVGFCEMVKRLGLSIREEYVVESVYNDAEQAAKATGQLLGLDSPPDCIFYSDDEACLGGMRLIREKGLRIPEDISVAGYDGIRLTGAMNLTTVKQDTREMGRRAAIKLIQLIEYPKITPVEQIIINGRLSCGQTVGRILK